MTISVRAASAADIGAIVWLNRDVQRLHADFEPSYFKSNVVEDEVAAFFAAKLALPENHFRLADGGDGPNSYVWFELQGRPETPFRLARKRIYIHHLSIRPGRRAPSRRRLCTVEASRSRGADRSHHDNRPGRVGYEHIGAQLFRGSRLCFIQSLPRQAPDVGQAGRVGYGAGQGTNRSASHSAPETGGVTWRTAERLPKLCIATDRRAAGVP